MEGYIQNKLRKQDDWSTRPGKNEYVPENKGKPMMKEHAQTAHTDIETLLWLLVILLLAISAFTALPVFTQEMPPQRVRAAQVQAQSLQEYNQVTGDLRAARRSVLAALEDGQVLELAVREGSIVETGDLIARLDDRRLKAQLRAARANRSRALSVIAEQQAEEVRARKEWERARVLHDRDDISDQALDNALAALNVATARVESSRQQVELIDSEIELLNVRLDDTVIHAPFDGQVIMRHTEIGEYIQAGEDIATLVSTGKLEAWLEVPEDFAAAARNPEGDIQVNINSMNIVVPGTNPRIVSDIDPRSRTFSLVIDIEDTGGNGFLPGMSITGMLPTSRLKRQLTIPRDALLRDARGAYVYRTTESEGGTLVASPTPVRVLFGTEDGWVVESPQLSEADQVIIEGNERLFPEAPIALLNGN